MMRVPGAVQLSLLVVFGLLLGAPLSGQTPARRNVRDGVYTAAQADRGQTVFRGTCESCHAPRYFTGGFLRNWTSVGELFDFTVGNMPEDAPGSLTAQQYADVMAYVIKLNNLPAGDKELPTDLAELQTINFAAPPQR
jgi:mono/diheme cytochrome c family protein